MKNEEDKYIAHLNRIIDNLNQHWHSIQLLLSHVSKPLVVDDRGLANVLKQMFTQINIIIESIQNLDLTRTYGEIKYIGKRLNEIEMTLAKIKEEGIKKNVQLDISCNGHKMIENQFEYNSINEIKENNNLDELLKTLTDREGEVLIHRLGLNGEKPKSFVNMGILLGISAERCGVVFSKVKRKLNDKKRINLIKKIDYPELNKLLV